jgi:phage shock protein C
MAGRRLVRNGRDKKIAGVCAGLADYFGLDVTLLRIGFLLFALFGVGEIVYLVIWLVAPREDPVV